LPEKTFNAGKMAEDGVVEVVMAAATFYIYDRDDGEQEE